MPGTVFAAEREAVAEEGKDDTVVDDEKPADKQLETGKERISETIQPTDVRDGRNVVRNAITKTIYTPEGPKEVYRYPYPFGHGVNVSENTD
jgi:hypothetical protein